MLNAKLGILPSKTRSKIILAFQIHDYQLGVETTLRELKWLIKSYEDGRKGGGGPYSTISPERISPESRSRPAKQGGGQDG